MNTVSGIILICVGVGFILFEFKVYKEVYEIKDSWLRTLMFIIDVLGEGVSVIGLILILAGLILVASEVFS